MILLNSLIDLTKIALEGRNLETEQEPHHEEKKPSCDLCDIRKGNVL